MTQTARLSAPSPNRRAAFALALAALALPEAASAQTAADDAAVVPELLEFRERLKAAIAQKDARTLEKLYASRYAHWRDSGRFQPKSTRIADILAGEKLIETEPETQLVIQPFGPVTAIGTGVTEISLGGNQVEFSWLVVYVKIGGEWQVAMSTSNRIGRG